MFKAMGVRPCVPDLVIIGRKFGLAFIELKAGKKKPTAIQAEVHALLTDMGYPVVVANSLEQVEKFIQAARKANP